ncbi:T4SS effector SidA family protein [Legionella tucsonensis]|uniref:SidA protein, substrate of the Dot/Icm transport system n=1 Tax=Legionella tucsonensis TaxID=40335 RepID=A0A0W0ZV93_9GAMM|nr:T4SS effector SidA family protein [Legionella tucsonensis]KTD73068.1 SidA protein, substrate of the Dot/Icm transport system [Legionella tucsonensis]
MVYPHKQHVILSEKMDDLKKRIIQKKKEQKSLIEITHKKGKLSQRLLEGTQKFFDLIASFFSSSKELPIVGFVFQMISVIPNAITTITDKNSSIGSKILAVGLLLALTALGITAFTLGGIVAAKIGLALASLATLIEGITFIGAIVNKYQTSKAYKEKKEFIDLLKNQNIDSLKNDKYRARLAIRALELEHLLEKSTNELHKKEFEFIKTISNKIDLSDFPDDSPVSKLSKLYKDRKDLISYLGRITQLVDQKEKKNNSIANEKNTEDTSTLIKLINDLQQQIAQIDEDIENITEPLHELKQNDLLANEGIPKSLTNFALGGAGVVFSIMGLMILLSAVAVPPIIGPILVGFGIGMAIFGVVKWGIELYETSKDEKFMQEREEENEGIILEEALDQYEHGCTYSKAMRPILYSQVTITPSESQNIAANDLESPSIKSTNSLESPEHFSKRSGEFQI